MDGMVELAQVRWILLEILNHFQAFFSHGPFVGARRFEVVVPLLDQSVLAERVTDAFKADERCDEWKIRNRYMIGDDEFFADTAQVFFEDSQSAFNALGAVIVSGILQIKIVNKIDGSLAIKNLTSKKIGARV